MSNHTGRSMLSNDWRSYGATISSFDDGHIPENLKDSHKETKIVQYDLFQDQQQQHVVHVYESAFADTDLLDAIYTKTAGSDPESNGNNAWGDYVTIEQIERCWKSNNESESIVVKIAAGYLRLALGEGSKNPKRYSSSKSNSQPLFSREDLKEAHGVAVWGLAAPCGVSACCELLLRSLANSAYPLLFYDYHLDSFKDMCSISSRLCRTNTLRTKHNCTAAIGRHVAVFERCN